MMVTKCCFTSTETVGLLGRGAQDVHFDFHTAPELCQCYIALVPVKYMLTVMLVGMQTVAMNFPPGERCKNHRFEGLSCTLGSRVNWGKKWI